MFDLNYKRARLMRLNRNDMGNLLKLSKGQMIAATHGQILAQTAVTLDQNVIVQP